MRGATADRQTAQRLSQYHRRACLRPDQQRPGPAKRCPWASPRSAPRSAPCGQTRPVVSTCPTPQRQAPLLCRPAHGRRKPLSARRRARGKGCDGGPRWAVGEIIAPQSTSDPVPPAISAPRRRRRRAITQVLRHGERLIQTFKDRVQHSLNQPTAPDLRRGQRGDKSQKPRKKRQNGQPCFVEKTRGTSLRLHVSRVNHRRASASPYPALPL